MPWSATIRAVVLWTLGSLAVVAQVPNLGSPVITNYLPQQYKASNQNWVAVQDRRGVMYFGNTGGVLEFDGERWNLIVTPSTATRSLTCGPDGTIYYGAIGDFGYLAASPTGKISAVSLKEAIPATERAFNDVWQAESCADGIYFLTRTKIFRFYDGKVTVLAGKFASSQACVLNDTLFYADSEQGICLVDGDQVVPIPALAGVYNGKRITLAPFGPHELLVGRHSGDFYRLDLSALWNETSRRYEPIRMITTDVIHAFPTELDAFVSDKEAYLYKLVPLGLDTFAISTVKAGIIIFDRTGKITRAINKGTGLLDNSVLALLVDRFNNLWAPNNTGISHIELSVPQSLFESPNGIEGASLSLHLHQDRLFVGTYQNLLVQMPYQYTLKKQVPKYLPLKDNLTEVWQFLNIEGVLVAATSGGLCQIQGETIVKVPGSAHAYCLGVSRRWPGHIFVGIPGGLVVFKNTDGQFALIGRVEGIQDTIRRITEDSNSDLWLNTEVQGVLRAHFASAMPTEVQVQSYGPEQGLPGLTDLRAAFHGTTLYVMTPQGLYSATIQPWNLQSSNQLRFTPDAILGKAFSDPSTAINNMVSDGKGGYFFSTSSGVVWARPDSNGRFQMTSKPFQGLSSYVEMIYVHPNGSVWLPGDVLRRVDPWMSKDYDQSFDILIRKVVTKGKHLLFEGTHSRENSAFGLQRTLFQQAQDAGEIPQLPYRENALFFEFSASFYEKPGTTQFAYLLEGFDEDWSEWGASASKEYTNIYEGRYRFRVRARNLYGTLGQEAAYTFRVLPPWYRTWWAILIWISGGGAALLGIIYLYTLKLKREKDLLEQLVAERTEQLHNATLTDPLTGLRNRRFITEILQEEVRAFLGFKNHVLEAKNNRGSTSEQTVFGLFLIDMDHFKQVNDSYGHVAGDKVLKQFAEILKASVRQDDEVMRVGGEEFLVVLKRTVPDYLHTFATRLLGEVASTIFDLGNGTTIRKTCSIGYVDFPIYANNPCLLSFEQSIMVADLGMYYAKNHGRNQAIFLEEGPLLPAGEEILQKTVTSIEFTLQEGHLKIGRQIEGPSVKP